MIGVPCTTMQQRGELGLTRKGGKHRCRGRTCAIDALLRGMRIGKGGHGLRGRAAAAAAVEEGKDVGEVVELGAAAGHAMAHPVVQEPAV